MKEKILEICMDLCGEEISEDEQLIVTGLFDSFRIMELICSLEETFHITFQPEEIMELEHFSCVDCMAAIVSSKLEKTS